MGDSYFVHSRRFAIEVHRLNLGLEGAEVSWLGKRGLRWLGGFQSYVDLLLQGRTPPDVLCLHLGGNDLGSSVQKHSLPIVMQRDLERIHSAHPLMRIVFSLINERAAWRALDHPIRPLNRMRQFVNREMVKNVEKMGGTTVDHPQIRHDNLELYHRDQCHLSDLGHGLFLDNIAQAIAAAIQRC